MKLQQGDVLIRKIEENGNLNLDNENLQNHLILAEGEVTGHKHEIVAGVAKLYLIKSILYLKVLSETATLRHEEHKPIDIEKGLYKIDKVREYDHFTEEMRQVMD